MKFLLVPGIPLAVITAALDLDQSSLRPEAIAILHGLGRSLPLALVILFLFLCLRRR